MRDIFASHRPKLTHLTWVDIAILTVIFFGDAIVKSNIQFLELLSAGQVAPETLSFDSEQNWIGIATELTLLFVAFIYLKIRNFDFARLNFTIDRYTLIRAIGYGLLASLVASILDWGIWSASADVQMVESAGEPSDTLVDYLAQTTPSLALFALLNGFFEELYFLGILFATDKKNWRWLFLLAILVRFSFHTYQGVAGALVITSLGVVFFALRCRHSHLMPFMLAHSIFDVLGLSFLLTLAFEWWG